MKKWLLILVCSLMVGCAPRIAIKPDYALSKIKRVAILPFKPFNSARAVIICDRFTTELMKTNMFEIVERGQVREVLKEYELTEELFYDESTFDKMANFLGVDAVIIGSGGLRVMSARLIDIETGIVVWSVSSSRVKSLVKHLAKEIKKEQKKQQKKQKKK